MNALKNKVQLIGRLGSDPELRRFDNNRMLSSFSLATSENYKDKKGNWKEDTSWHNIVAWGTTAERVQKIVGKGDEVMIEGKLTNNTYEDKDGVKRYSTQVVIHEILLLKTNEKPS